MRDFYYIVLSSPFENSWISEGYIVKPPSSSTKSASGFALSRSISKDIGLRFVSEIESFLGVYLPRIPKFALRFLFLSMLFLPRLRR